MFNLDQVVPSDFSHKMQRIRHLQNVYVGFVSVRSPCPEVNSDGKDKGGFIISEERDYDDFEGGGGLSSRFGGGVALENFPESLARYKGGICTQRFVMVWHLFRP